jgi:hypothetical protein
MWEELEHVVGEILRRSPPICFYIDAVDEEFANAPMYWMRCQEGLFLQVMRLLRNPRLGGRLHLIISLRDIVLSTVLRGEHQNRYRGESHIRVLDWDRAAIQYFLHDKLARLPQQYWCQPDAPCRGVGDGVGVLSLAVVVASSVVGQRRADAAVGLPTPVGLPAGRNALRAALRQQRSAQAAFRSAVADQVSSGRQLEAEMRDAQQQGTWDDEDWAYRKRVESRAERTLEVLEGSDRGDLASAVAELEAPPRPPFETLLKGYSPGYARLAGLLGGRIGLLEEAQR